MTVMEILGVKRANFTKNIELIKQIDRPREITFTTYEDEYEEEEKLKHKIGF